jgi:hypothetical protein
MSPTNFLAWSPPEMIAAFVVPLAPVAMVLGIVYSRHQVKMAQIMYGQGGKKVSDEVTELRSEVAQLKELVQNQALALELARSRPPIPVMVPAPSVAIPSAPGQESVEQRIG